MSSRRAHLRSQERAMNVLMLGNSFTYVNDMPGMLAKELDASVTEVVRGGAYLHSFLDQEDELSQLGMSALLGDVHEREGREMCRTFGGAARGDWDYVVLQEQSFNAVGNEEDYIRSAVELCRRAWSVGAVPVIYGTWAYRAGSSKLKSTFLTHDEMLMRLRRSAERAAQEGGALLADVGMALEHCGFDPYTADDYHPGREASMLAARILADTMRAHQARSRACAEVELREVDAGNWRELARMELNECERGFAPDCAMALAEAAYAGWQVKGIYADGIPAGLIVHGVDARLGMERVRHVIVDRRMRGAGIARAALAALYDNGASCDVAATAHPGNARALGLLRRMGFEMQERLMDGEWLMIRRA